MALLVIAGVLGLLDYIASSDEEEGFDQTTKDTLERVLAVCRAARTDLIENTPESIGEVSKALNDVIDDVEFLVDIHP